MPSKPLKCKKCSFKHTRKSISKDSFSEGCSVDMCGKLTDSGVSMRDAVCIFLNKCPLDSEVIVDDIDS